MVDLEEKVVIRLLKHLGIPDAHLSIVADTYNVVAVLRTYNGKRVDRVGVSMLRKAAFLDRL